MTVTTGFTQLMTGDAAASPSLGAPGVYFAAPVARDRLDVEAMDVAAFIGVAPRGPAWVPTTNPLDGTPLRARSVATPVDSWDGYVELFGGVEGPGLLPRAVSAYFAQGARRAYIVRVVPPQPEKPSGRVPTACARLTVILGPEREQPRSESEKATPWLTLYARNEGTWGDRLRVEVTFTLQRLGVGLEVDGQRDRIRLPRAGLLVPGTTLRFSPPSGRQQYGVVEAIETVPREQGSGRQSIAIMDALVPLGPQTVVEVVEANLSVVDLDPGHRRQEVHHGLGLDAQHPRYLGKVLQAQSRLVEVDEPPTAEQLDAALREGFLVSQVTTPGQDRWGEITHDDLFADASTEGTGGVDAVAGADEVASVIVPDLYWPTDPQTTPGVSPEPHRSGAFVTCASMPSLPRTPGNQFIASRLVLDPTDPAKLPVIVAQQTRLIEAAQRMQRIALLDVPPGLSTHQVTEWRAQLDSAYAAAYHPWLSLPAPFDRTLAVPPSAVAAGIIARSELTSGIARGPANTVATGVVDVAAPVASEDHGMLHRLGVNVFAIDSDGILLTAARTLSSEAAWRQLSVRRLLLSIERSVRYQLQWCVFENNDDHLRDNLRTQLDALMAQLFAQGCFAGSTPAESWFVHIASGTEAALEQDAGQLLAEIGVAPAEPTEFIIIRVAVQAEGEVKSSFASDGGVSARG